MRSRRNCCRRNRCGWSPGRADQDGFLGFDSSLYSHSLHQAPDSTVIAIAGCGQADEAVKQCADDVCEEIDRDGILHALQRCGLCGE
ncbi:MAG: hypothetical protein PUF68_00815 [Lactimicrobium massiliense]|nr:hypothetical protein [Lactimicrobium massiliense]MDD6457294.1 hypothetical protein [Lactimicrobium massiliense]